MHIYESMRCVNHRNTETNLSCGKCGDPICVKCVVQTPVGIRCKKCAGLRPIPTFDVSTQVLTKAILVGVGMAFLSAFIWSFVPFVGTTLIVLAGLAIGEVISISVNRKRGKALQFVAGGSTVLALILFRLFPVFLYVGTAMLSGAVDGDAVLQVVFSAFINIIPSIFFNLFGLITIALGVYLSIYKFR